MIWLIGNRGMLGSECEQALKKNNQEYVSSDMEVDIRDYQRLEMFAGKRKIEWIINCSAYTAVDKAESEPEAAYSINSDGVRNIAKFASAHEAALIHFSTDYVFSGAKKEPYSEDDEPSPTGVYGKSKLEGEKHIVDSVNKYYIIRIAWLYGRHGKNFVHTMLKLFNERDIIKVVNDQWGNPTCTGDVADIIVRILGERKHKYGVFHFTNEGRTTWYEFSMEIYRLAKKYGIVKNEVNIIPIASGEYPTLARRPLNSCLSKNKISAFLNLTIPDWKSSLETYISSISGDYNNVVQG